MPAIYNGKQMRFRSPDQSLKFATVYGRKKKSGEEKHMIKTVCRDTMELFYTSKNFHRSITCQETKPISLVTYVP